MRETVKIIGPCSKYIDGQGWTTEVPVDKLEELGFVRLEKGSVVLTEAENNELTRKANLTIQFLEKQQKIHKEDKIQLVKQFADTVSKECMEQGLYPVIKTVKRISKDLERGIR